MLNSKEILHLLKSSLQGYLKPDHILFTENNKNLLQQHRKLGAINNKDEIPNDELSSSTQSKIFCNVFGCSAVFDNTASYQSHYNGMHRFICAECKKSFPTDHFLDLHLSENHDSYFLARLERGEHLFKCYLEECKEVFADSLERKQHCIKYHKFPNNFRFDQIIHKTCLKKQDSSKSKKEEKMEVDGEFKPKLKPITSRGHKFISFGHQKEKTFYSNKKMEADKLLDDMNALKQAIDTI